MNRSKRDVVLTVIWVTFICCLTALASSSCSVARGILPPAFDRWAGAPYEANCVIFAPDSIASGKAFSINVSVGFGSPAHVITSKNLAVNQAGRIIDITIIAREQSGIFPMVVPPPEIVSFPVKLDAIGEWTITCGNQSHAILAYGDWQGDESEAEITDFLLPVHVTPSEETSLRVTTAHQDGEHVFTRFAVDTDTENNILRLHAYERAADTGGSRGAWNENTVTTIVFPSEGSWLIVFGNGLLAHRNVDIQDYYPEGLSLSFLSQGPTPKDECPRAAGLPTSFAVPSEARANTPLECPFSAPIPDGSNLQSYGADYYFDEAGHTISAFIYTNWHWLDPDSEDVVSAQSSTRLVFPSPGDWVITFHRSDGATFQETVAISD